MAAEGSELQPWERAGGRGKMGCRICAQWVSARLLPFLELHCYHLWIWGVQEVFFKPPSKPTAVRGPWPSLLLHPPILLLPKPPHPQQKIRINNRMDYWDPWWSVKMNRSWDHGIILMSNVLMLVIVWCLCRRISLFLRSTYLNTWPLRKMISSTFEWFRNMFVYLEWQSKYSKVIIIGESGWRVFRSSLNHFCN